MSRYSGSTFAKPENALKRAEELINVGQKQAALQALHDVITSKRHRTWQKTLEKIMFKYVELCVDMRKGRIAKDGLMQYRIICQQVNVASLEEVIKHFLSLATERAEQAQAQAQQATLDVEDLEEDQRPEDIMMSFVSAEKEKDRTDRELVTPWFKFLWETYRTVLENLRNNSKLESLYAMTAHRAFQFCLQYKRTTEFRRLCEILRNHLANLNKYRDQRDRPDLTLPETLQLYLDTRFEQLKVATELELWQEAFRAVEDIHGLLAYAKKSPKPQMMATYYSKLTRIFWVSENHLYHAYAWYKLYNLSKSYNKNLTQKDLQMMASAVLLATLIVLPYDRKHGAHHFELEMEKDRNLRMANLLGFSLDIKRDAREVLSRSALLADLIAKGVLNNVPPEVKEIYTVLETEFHPLDLASKVQPLLARLKEVSGPMSAATPISDFDLQQYIPALEKVTTLRALSQVSQVFQTVRLSMLYKKLPFGDAEYVEKLAVDAMQHNYLNMKINHCNQVLQFGGYGIESEKIRPQLSLLTKRLNRAVVMMSPEALASQAEERKTLIDEAKGSAESDNRKILARTKVIEKRKEEQERLMQEQEKEEEARRMKQQLEAEQLEQKRLAVESARREKERIQREIEEKELEEARQLLLEAQKKGKKIKKTGDLKLDKRTLMEEALSEQIRERQEMERKLSKLAKTLDYLERAKREEERPLLEAAYQAKLVEDEKYHAEQVEVAKVEHKEKWELDIVEKRRLVRMWDDKELFQKQVQTRRADEFEKLRLLRNAQLEELRMIRHQERLQRRKMEYYKRRELDRLQQKLEEEEARRAAEEEERRKEEEAREEERRRLRELEEAAKLQRQREAEIESQKAAERERLVREQEEAAQQSKPAVFTPSFKRSEAPPAAERELRDDRSRPFVPNDREREGAYRPPVVDREREGAYRTPGGGDREREGAYRPPGGDREREGAYRPPGGDRERESNRDERGGSYRPPVARDGPPAARGGDDGWRREGKEAPPPRAGGGGARWERERDPRERTDGPPAPRDRERDRDAPLQERPSASRFVPSARRQEQPKREGGGW